MKLISLNAWGGKIFKPLIEFIKQQAEDTDIFCFQEVFKTTSVHAEQGGFRLNLYNEIAKSLNNHQGYFATCLNNCIAGTLQPSFVDFDLSWGLAIFVHKKITVSSHHELFIYGTKDSFNPKDLNSLPRNIQYIDLVLDGNKFTIFNLHGIWAKEGKGDTDSRINQSKRIIELLNQQRDQKILCGDFNLDLNTESIRMLESNMINLIRRYNIQNTRSKYFPGDDKFADYTFISPDIKVKSFEVPDVEISDHLPMVLEFS